MTAFLYSRRMILVTLCLLATSNRLHAKEGPLLLVNQEMQTAARAFISSLDEAQRQQLTFDFQGPERTDWHFIPKQRVGVSLKEMNLPQRRAAHVLMRSVLSEKGYLKATTVMSLEQVLRLLEADRENVEEIRDQEKYWFAVYGDPSDGKPWGWRVEGHHLSLNFTSVDGEVAGVTPIFFGSNPAEIRVGPRRGLRVLGDEEDQARDMLSALTPTQLAQAIISAEAPADVLTAPGKPVVMGEPKGLPASEMTAAQRQQFSAMVTSFLQHLQPELATKEIRQIEAAGIDELYFAWAGGQEPDEKHYFRLQSPTFIFEYDNTQGNHAHLVWHSIDNDFAASVLQRHYQNSPHHQGKAE